MNKRPGDPTDSTGTVTKRPRLSPRLIVKGKRVITNGKVLENAYVVASGNTIVSIQTETPGGLAACDLLKADIVIPGLIDIHHHGLCGDSKEVTEFWLSDRTAKLLPSLGSTAVLAMIPISGNDRQTDALLASLESQVQRSRAQYMEEEPRARVSGIHAVLSGCEKYPGMSQDEFAKLLDKMPSCRIMTLSPSVEAASNYNCLRELLRRHITPALGPDTKASLEDVLGCIRAAGAQRLHLTHPFDSPDLERATVGLIRNFPPTAQYKGMLAPTIAVAADCPKIHPLTVHLALQAREPRDVALVTEAILHDEAKPGEFEYAGRPVEIRTIDPPHAHAAGANGVGASGAAHAGQQFAPPKRVVYQDSDEVVGGCTTPLGLLRRVVHELGVPLVQAVTMLTETPARIARLDDLGSLRVGCRADMLLLTERLDLVATVIDGRVAYQAPAVPTTSPVPSPTPSPREATAAAATALR